MNVIKVKDPVTGEWVRAGLGGTQNHASRHGKDGTDPLTPEMIGARPDSWVPTLEDVGAAPAGYGLGGDSIWLGASGDLNTCTDNAYYRWSSGSVCPANVPVAGESGHMHVVRYGADELTQTVFIGPNINYSYRLTVWRRIKKGGAGWYPWECENPPMELGKEYRTTERYMGKPVYVKVVGFGALPATTAKTFGHGIENIERCVSVELVGENTKQTFTDDNQVTGVYFSGTSVVVTTSKDLTSYTVNAILKYTKTTD